MSLCATSVQLSLAGKVLDTQISSVVHFVIVMALPAALFGLPFFLRLEARPFWNYAKGKVRGPNDAHSATHSSRLANGHTTGAGLRVQSPSGKPMEEDLLHSALGVSLLLFGGASCC